ncbi:hypothetical protein HYV81_02390 [Candidatus Woesearchaeota archaeon]|nr:hypothetical protein [Candidatus Woesearchaeota archaeon]
MKGNRPPVILLLLIILLGCTPQAPSSSQNSNEAKPAETEFTVYQNSYYKIQMQYPKDWLVKADEAGIAAVFVPPLKSNDTFAESFNIVVDELSDPLISLDAYTASALALLKEALPDIEVSNPAEVQLSSSPGRKVVYSSTGPQGNKLRVLQVWTVRNGNAYILSFAADEEEFQNFQKEVQRMVDSFEIVEQPAEKPLEQVSGKGNIDPDLVNDWRIYSQTIFYDIGGRGASDISFRLLELNKDATWKFGDSKGTWEVKDIEEDDWKKWGSESYGPAKKVVLHNWNKAEADGPIEYSPFGGIDFFWVIYRVEPPTVANPGIIQMKFGHTNDDLQ